jgi:hypothetical protein
MPSFSSNVIARTRLSTLAELAAPGDDDAPCTAAAADEAVAAATAVTAATTVAATTRDLLRRYRRIAGSPRHVRRHRSVEPLRSDAA